jgi:hypothetical protein
MEHLSSISTIILMNALDDAYVFTKTNVLVEKNEFNFNHNIRVASMYLKKYIMSKYRDNS